MERRINMCSPTLLAVGMGGMQMMGTLMKNKATNEAAESSAVSANRAASYDYQQLMAKAGETDEQAAQDKLQRQLQTKREHSTIAVAMGEAGVSGNSSLRVLNNSLMQGSFDEGVIEANRESKQRQILGEVDATHATNVGRVNEAESQTIDPALGAMNAVMAGAEGGFTGYSMGKSMFGGKKMTTKGKK
jgi:hypothetical protein